LIVDGKLSVPKVILHLGKTLLLTFLVSVLVTVVYERMNRPEWLNISGTPLTVVGAALSIFIAFRNNTVYDRWWEGRTLWGALINQSRTFARQVMTFGKYTAEHGDREALEEWQRQTVMRHIAFVHAFRLHLRDSDPTGPLGAEPFLQDAETVEYREVTNVPSAILHRQGVELHEAWRRGWIQDFHLNALDNTLTELTNIQGGCERIKNTPLPPVYTYLAYRVVVTFCCLIPLALVSDLRLYTPFVSLLISFTFLVLNRISQLLETPFATRVNDLPLTAMSRTIEIDLRERIGAGPIPEPIKPVDGVLL
jgi:putative membrane protein